MRVPTPLLERVWHGLIPRLFRSWRSEARRRDAHARDRPGDLGRLHGVWAERHDSLLRAREARTGDHLQRWTAKALLIAEESWRKVKGWQQMSATMDSLNPVVTRKLA